MILSMDQTVIGLGPHSGDIPLCVVEGRNGLIWRFFDGTDQDLINFILEHDQRQSATTIAVCNVHMFIEARKDNELSSAIRSISFSLCDGQPIAWLASLVEGRKIGRVTGPDIFEKILLNHLGHMKVALVGGTPAILEGIRARLNVEHLNNVLLIDPGVVTTGMPPDGEIVRRLQAFQPQIIFVGLGCPKQEKWMHETSKLVGGVLVGVGAAFQYFIGDIKRAPKQVRALGLEWAYRLIQQPHLLGRYGRTNIPFLILLFSVLVRRAICKRRIKV